MTVLARRPMPFSRIPRNRFDAHVAALEEQRDRAIGRERETRERIARWLEQAADAHDADARHLDRLGTKGAVDHKAVAGHLRQLLVDLEATW